MSTPFGTPSWYSPRPRPTPRTPKRRKPRRGRAFAEADDGPRTRDLRLGKPTLYQLSYVRVTADSIHVRRVGRRGVVGFAECAAGSFPQPSLCSWWAS